MQITAKQCFYVCDFDGQWWEGYPIENMVPLKVRRNLLLQPIPESGSLDSQSANKGETTT